jgi:hypothetical protein
MAEHVSSLPCTINVEIIADPTIVTAFSIFWKDV